VPRYVKYSRKRWIHPRYRKAYVFKNRNGMAYTCINSYRQATGYEFLPKNRLICMDILDRRLREAEKTLELRDSNFTLKDLIARFHKDKISTLSQRTKKIYIRLYKKYLSQDYNLADIYAIRDHILDVRNQDKLSNNTLWKNFQQLKKIFDYGIELDWIDKNPITRSMVPSYKNIKVIICSEEHINSLISYFLSKDLKQIALSIEFVYLTAIRIQELLDLQWKDFNDDFFLIKGKGGLNRIFPLNPFPRLKEIIQELKQLNPKKPFLWLNQQTPAKSLRLAVKKLNLDKITYHIIRKAAINRWRVMGIDTETRNLLAGHTKDVERTYYLTSPDVKYLEKKISKM